MKKSLKILAAILAIVLVGTVSSNATAVADSIQEKIISVTGEGKVMAVPDICILTLGIEAENKEVVGAQGMASDAMNDVIATLKKNGVLEKDIQTSKYSIYPVRKEKNTWWGGGKIVAYRVRNVANVKIRDVNKIGKIIDDAAKAGGDLIRIGEIRFNIDDPKPYYREARRKAVNDAIEKAEQLAELSGVKLGRPISISERGGLVSSVERATYSRGAAPPISPGEMEIKLTVNITYEIKE